MLTMQGPVDIRNVSTEENISKRLASFQKLDPKSSLISKVYPNEVDSDHLNLSDAPPLQMSNQNRFSALSDIPKLKYMEWLMTPSIRR